MGEEVIISVIPEVVKPNRGTRRNLAARSIASGSPSHLQTGEDVIPHYVKASTGSCHDSCKYGIKHVDEAKKRHPKFPRISGSKQMPNGEHGQTDVLIVQERSKKLELNLHMSQLKNEFKDELEQTELPPEKIIFLSDSSTNNTEGSQESSNIKSNGSLHNQTSYEHSPENQNEESSEECVSIKYVTPSSIHKSGEVADHRRKDMPIIQVEESSLEPASIKFMISPPTSESIGSHECIALNQSEGSSSGTASPTYRIGLVEHAEGSGAENLSNELLPGNKDQILLRLPEHSTSTEVKDRERKSYAKQRHGNQLGGANREVSHVRSRTSSVRNSTASALSVVDRPCKERSQLKTPSIDNKSKRDVNKLKNAQKKSEDTDGSEVTEVVELTAVKKYVRPAFKKQVKSVKPEIEFKRSPSTTRTAESVVSKVVKKKSLAPPKIHALLEPVTSKKVNKQMLKSPSPSISRGGLTCPRNENIKHPNKSNHGEDHVLEPPFISPSPKSHLNQVSSTKLCRYRSTSPAVTMKDQAKAGRFGKSSDVGELKSEKIEPNAIKQTFFREPKLYSSIRKEKHKGSALRSTGANEPLLHKEVTHRKYSSSTPKLEIKGRHRSTSSLHSDGKLSIHRLNFRTGKVVNLQSENNIPISLRFKQAKTVTRNQNAEGQGRKTSSGNKTEAGAADFTTTTSTEVATIVLRHPDIRDKKEAQCLFNHVIEETASKLVESRSRVKALVGAFETVISLQEGKAVAAP